MRRFIYLFEFIKNIFKYMKNKKYHCKKLQVWCGTTCTLRCKDCSQLFPYIKQELYDINNVIEDLKVVLKYIEADSIHIIGGEPFTNKNIAQLIEFVCEVSKNKPNKIISNGTIIPDNKVIELLAKNKDHIYVTVSNYPTVSDRQEKFMQKMKENNVRIKYVKTDDYWFYMGDNTEKEIRGTKILKRNFKACHDKSCNTLAGGVLSVCPRMHNSRLIDRFGKKEKTFFIEHLAVDKIPKIDCIAKALIATCFCEKTYRESCRYCWGLSSMSGRKVQKAQQLERIAK